MGTLSLTALKVEVKAGLGNRADLDSRLTQWLNMAQIYLAKRHTWNELESTASLTLPYTGAVGDRLVALPTLRDLWAIHVLDTNNSVSLRVVPQQQFVKLLPDNRYIGRSRPQVCTQWNQNIEIHPLPDKEYTSTVYYTAWPTAFSDASAGAVSVYLGKDDILIDLAVVFAMRSLNKNEEANNKMALVERWIQEAIAFDDHKPAQGVVPDRDITGSGIGSYWNNPFIKEAP